MFKRLYTFKTGKSYRTKRGITKSQGSAAVGGKRNYYYLVNSYAYKKDCGGIKNFNKLKGTSYVLRFRLSIKDNKVKVVSDQSWEFHAGKKVSKYYKKKYKDYYRKDKTRRLEFQDLYIKGNRIYVNAEGGNYYLDLIGSYAR